MKKSELRQIIREEVEFQRINEGLVSMIFGNISKSKAKKIEKELERDPDYKKLSKDIQNIQGDIKKIKDKYKDSDNPFASLVTNA